MIPQMRTALLARSAAAMSIGRNHPAATNITERIAGATHITHPLARTDTR